MSNSFDFTQTNELLQHLSKLAPETVDQMITFGFISHCIGLGIAMLLIICSLITAMCLRKKGMKNTHWNDDIVTSCIFACVFVCVIFVVVAIVNTIALIQLVYTPNAYVIDQLTH